MRSIKSYKLEDIRLGDIRREWNGELITLHECHPYKYLKGEKQQYINYTQENKILYGYKMSSARFEALRQSLQDGYDQKFVPVLNNDNTILDGQHRCCVMLHKFGQDYKIKVLKLTFT